ncbi:cytosolic factor, phosphatidylinositol/phosphatidylcholine transfer protein [Kappamyces sp. JEL0829]|nr:cytosolic factor, phosphatidylinositol/phosphatidylcholine transfer protein [Kappamyces sp. JEL0829]
MSPNTQSLEEKAFSQFKEILTLTGKLNASHNDILLMRFLRARQLNVQNALKMFQESEEWRAKMNVDKIVTTFRFHEHEAVSMLYPRYYHKTDKLGRSVYIESLGRMDVDKLFQVTSKERLIQHLVREFEKYTSIKCGKEISQGLVILDLLNAPLSQFNSIRLLIGELSSISSNYYPETLGKMVIINAPWLFTAIWTVVRAMLDERTAAKISVLGSNYQKELLSLIHAENLPTYLGGTCQCRGGCEHSDTGPWNDGAVEAYPQPFWENFTARDRGYDEGFSSAASSYHTAMGQSADLLAVSHQ